MKAKKSIKIVDFFKFLDVKDSGYKNNYEISDLGTAALYILLFKLMGDKRSYQDLWKLDHPPATEISSAAESGDYSWVIEICDANNHNCELKENGATLIINDEIIDKLESFIPQLVREIENNFNSIEGLNLNEILKEWQINYGR